MQVMYIYICVFQRTWTLSVLRIDQLSKQATFNDDIDFNMEIPLTEFMGDFYRSIRIGIVNTNANSN